MRLVEQQGGRQDGGEPVEGCHSGAVSAGHFPRPGVHKDRGLSNVSDGMGFITEELN